MSTGHRRPFPNVSVGGEHLYLRSIPPCPSCDRLTRTRPWPFFGPGREQADDLGDTRRAQVRPAGRRIDVPQAGPAVELRQRAEAGPSAGLAARAAPLSPASPARGGASGARSTIAAEPAARPVCRILAGFRVHAPPLSPGAIVTRPRQPWTVPLT